MAKLDYQRNGGSQYIYKTAYNGEGANELAQRLKDKSNPKFKFGKYKGRRFSDVPQSYVEWMCVTTKSHGLQDLLIKELQRRDPKYRI